MAKGSISSNNVVRSKRKKRPGVHSKCKNSKLKKSRNYAKKYIGQGK